MSDICEKCHWESDRGIIKTKSGKEITYGCNNIGVDGWKCWMHSSKAPETCDDFCRKGEYEVTGMWKCVAEILDELKRQAPGV